ncbi:nSTAND1 domain-containing NTPase [Pseudofrankia inefficax]|uniref:Tetratricopeptide repeat protein n=1 Tax=Pseudofrankia inefficax (strain DSM 45817 / CECT 9037 / DDB 130130 / EuI1c) TaxID=298654 RepID=E3IX95_PSEI1|nr:tetratricopeptide repeat protein [Pseudofrankia inefficax]ADP84995.1 Tetratricopeptide repeat protein [Pseudofrankia inefficax]
MSGPVRRAPYVGLRSYQADDADLFFGRRDDSYRLAALWSSHRLVVLYGASGVGKTSLVAAGMRAQFPDEAAEMLPVGRAFQASQVPTAALPRHNPYTFALLSSWSPTDPPHHLSGLSIAEFFSQRSDRTDPYGDPLPILAVIDRFEELFRDFPHRQQYREQFIDDLAEAISAVPLLRLLISVREDSLASLLPYESRLSRDSRTRFELRPLQVPEAIEAATGPLRGTGRSFGAGVAERLVDDVRTTAFTDRTGETTVVRADRVEAVQLQVVCSALWDALPPDTMVITGEHLQSYGDLNRILAEFCGRAVAYVARDHGLPESALRDWLGRTFITELGTRNTVYEGASRTAGMPNAVAHAFVDRHILKAEWRSGSRWFELAHDRLIEPVRGGWRRSETELPDGRSVDYLRAAEAALADGELDLARKHALEAVRLAEGDLRAQAEGESFLGDLAFQTEKYEEAARRYRRGAELYELMQDSTAVGMLLAAVGQVLLREGRHDEAVVDLEGAVARLQGDRTLRTELADALWQAGQLRSAEGVYASVLSYAPDAVEALAGRGEVRVELGEFAAALEDLDILARLKPAAAGQPVLRAARARALAGLDRLADAQAEADAAFEAAPADPVVQWRAGIVAALTGDRTRAVALLTSALRGADPPLMPHRRTEARRLLEDLTSIDPDG